MTKKKKEARVEYSDQVREAMAKDPKLAEFLREFAANARQAMEGVDSGKYKDFGEAMEALGHPATPIEPEEMPAEAQDELYGRMSEEGIIASTRQTRALYEAIADAIGNDSHLYVVGCALGAIVAGWIDMWNEEPGQDGRAEFLKMVDKFDATIQKKKLS